MLTSPLSFIEISTQAFNHNLSAYKEIIGNKELGIVVKSNAYGHGLEQIVPLCQAHSAVQWLFVSTLREGLRLRALGYTKSILVLYFIDDDPALAAHHDIHLMVGDCATIDELAGIGKEKNIVFSVHLKIDTGMSRFGVAPRDAVDAAMRIKGSPFLRLDGVYSHLAQAAHEDQTMNKEQSESFSRVLDALIDAAIEVPIIHLSNSAGAMLVDCDPSTVVRIGLGAYGWWPSLLHKQVTQEHYPHFELKPVLSLKTRVYQLRAIAKGSAIGYNKSFISQRDMIAAFLPIGYAEGYPRRLSNKGVAFINGHYAPIIGMVAMSVTMVDVTDIPRVKAGDEVILIGNYPRVTATEIAHTMESFNARELLVGLSPLLPRKVIA